MKKTCKTCRWWQDGECDKWIWVPSSKVVTHSYTDGTRLSVCPWHYKDLPEFSASGASYSGVYHGAHNGRCNLCERQHIKPGT